MTSSTKATYTENVSPVITDKATLQRLLHVIWYTPGRLASQGVRDRVTAGIVASQDAAWRAANPDASDEEIALRDLASRTTWGLPVLVLGPPGCGKTQIIEGEACAAGLRAVTLVASQRQPEDVAGFPIPDHERGQVRRMADTWLDALTDDAGDGAVLVLDEITTADEPMMAAFLRVLSDRAAGDRALSNRVRIVAMGNRAGEAPNVRTMAPADANRFAHFTYAGPTAEEWAHWVLHDLDQQRDPRDPNAEERRVLRAWPAAMSAAKALVARYLGSIAPGELHAMNTQQPMRAEHPQSSGPWASQRTWEMAIRLLAGADVHGLSKSDTELLLRSVIGTGADGLLTYLKKQDLPNLAELVANKGTYTNAKGKRVTWKHDTKRLDMTFAVTCGLAGLMRDRINAGHLPMADVRDQVDWVAGQLLAIQGQDPDLVVPAVRLLASAGVLFESPDTQANPGKVKHKELVYPAGSNYYQLAMATGRYVHSIMAPPQTNA